MSDHHLPASESARTLDTKRAPLNLSAPRPTPAVAPSPEPGLDDSRLDSGFTVSARTLQGRLLITITGDALRKLDRPGVDPTHLSVLARHMPRFHALALEMASSRMVNHVVIEARDVNWTEDEIQSVPRIPKS